MNTLSRGVRNAFRNSVRTFSIVIILGLSIGLALSMLVARQAVQSKIQSVKSSIGNTITISPAGSRGFEGGGEPLTATKLQPISTLSNVTHLTEMLNDRLTATDTNLVSAIDAGTLGNRRAGNSGVNFASPNDTSPRSSNNSAPQVTRTFTPPVIVTGVNDLSDVSIYGGSQITYTSGQALDPTKDEDKAVVGKSLAEKNNLNVGSTFTAYGKPITVVGIFDTGNEFSNAGLVMSLTALQRLSAQNDVVTSAIVNVNSIDNVDSVTTAIKSTLGTAADVVNNQETAKAAVDPLENVKKISLFSLIGAVIAGAVIILLTMVMIVRERRREIGVLKAIGASNLRIMFQFVAEAITLTILGLIAGLLIGVAAANPVTKVLVNNSANSAGSSQVTQTRQRPGRGFQVSLRGFGNNSLTNIKNIQTSVGWDVLGYGLGAAFVMAIIGSALPAYFISKIRPAEVMRAE